MRRPFVLGLLPLLLVAGCATPPGGTGVVPALPQPPRIELFVVGDSFASQGGNPGTTTRGDLLLRTWWGGITTHAGYRPLHAAAPPGASVATPDAASIPDNGGWTPRGRYADALIARLGADRVAAVHHFGFSGSTAWGWAIGRPCTFAAVGPITCPQTSITSERLRAALAAVPSDRVPVVVVSVGANDLSNVNWIDPAAAAPTTPDDRRQADFRVDGGSGGATRTASGFVTRWYRFQQIEAAVRNLLDDIRTASDDRAEVILPGYTRTDLDTTSYRPSNGSWYEWAPGLVGALDCRDFATRSMLIGDDFAEWYGYALLGVPVSSWPPLLRTMPTAVGDAEALIDSLHTGGWTAGSTSWRRDSLHGVYAALAAERPWVTHAALWDVGSTTSNAHLLDCIHLRKEATTELTTRAVDVFLERDRL